MPRQVRIEFPGAFYHVMARGHQLQPIFASRKGADQELFLQTLGEVCERSGFRIWAWVLMRNHYHLVIETPKPNLVAGMSWFQNAYTRRFNSRHKEWGRLFGDRYKSILIDDERKDGGSSYLASLLDYVHLNPARAGIVSPRKKHANSLLDYPWSSVARGYAMTAKQRPQWMIADAGLELFGLKDNARGRRQFVERLDNRMAAEEKAKCGVVEIEGQTLHSTLRRGWYWGSEPFKEAMLEELEKISNAKQKVGKALPSCNDHTSGKQARDHDLLHAEAIIAEAVMYFGLKEGKDKSIQKAPYADLSVVATAWAICRNTSVTQRWIAERLSLGSRANVSERVRRFGLIDTGNLSKRMRKWKMMKF